MTVRGIYLHGWPDGAVDTATLAGHLTTSGLDLLEIGVTEATASTIAAIVDEYLDQIPDDGGEFVLIGYCGAAHYSLFVNERLTQLGRPPLACLALELVEFSGSTLLYGGFDRLAQMPAKTQFLRQILRMLPPFDEGIRAVSVDWLRVKLALKSRLLRLLGKNGVIEGRNAPWASAPFVRPLYQELGRPTMGTVVSYNAARPPSLHYGPAGSLARNFLGPVIVRSFDGMDHDSVLLDANAQRIAEVMVDDVAKIAAGLPMTINLHVAAS